MLLGMKPRVKSLAPFAAAFVVTSLAASPAHDRISKLPESKRNQVLTELMARFGESCEVTKSFFQGLDESKSAYWNVVCSNKNAYAIMMNDDGSNRVLECKRLRALSNIDCFKAF